MSENVSKFPFDITDIPEDEVKELLDTFHGEKTGFVQVGPHKYVMPTKYRKFAEELYNAPVRSDDVWIVTHPRSGTTVLQEMVWLLAHDLHYEEAKSKSLYDKSPFFERFTILNDETLNELFEHAEGNEHMQSIYKTIGTNSVPETNALSSPRVIKTHLLPSLLHRELLNTSKIVYMARNPKDVAVSYYHLNRSHRVLRFVGDFPKFWNFFQKGLVTNGPYWAHINEAWENRNHKNMLFLFYEDLVKDMKSTIRKVAEHIGKELSETQVDELADHLQIDNLRKYSAFEGSTEMLNPGEQDFVRKGKNNGWKDYFTPDMNTQADEWIEENLKKIPGFQFPRT